MDRALFKFIVSFCRPVRGGGHRSRQSARPVLVAPDCRRADGVLSLGAGRLSGVGGACCGRRAAVRGLSALSSAQPRRLPGPGFTAKKADNTDSYLWQPVLKVLASLPPRSRILDNGCGNGYFTRALHEEGFDVCGLDLAESGIFHARNL